MTTTPLWSIPEVAPSQDQKETTINNALVWLEGALADEYDGIAWTSNAFTVGNNAFSQHMAFLCPDNASASSVLTVPLLKKFFIVNNALGSHQVTVGGTTGASVVVPGGAVVILLCDGTDVITTTALAATSGVLSVGGVSGAIGVTGNIDVAGGTLTLSGMAAESVPAVGAIYSTGTHVAHLTLSADFELTSGTLSLTGVEHTVNRNANNGTTSLATVLNGGAGIAGEMFKVTTAATTALVYAFKHAGAWTNRGTLSVSTAGSLTITGSPTADVTLVPGDGVRITGQATHDTSFKNFGIVTMLKKVAGEWPSTVGKASMASTARPA